MRTVLLYSPGVLRKVRSESRLNFGTVSSIHPYCNRFDYNKILVFRLSVSAYTQVGICLFPLRGQALSADPRVLKGAGGGAG